MDLGKKGEGGFAESMMALMAVIVTLTLFMAVIPYAFADDGTNGMPTDFLNGLSVSDSGLHSETDLEVFMEDMGWDAMRLDLRVTGTDMAFSRSFGRMTSDDMITKSGTMVVSIDDGRKMNAEYHLAVWI